MRILHTADWHIGSKTDDADRLDEQAYLCRQIVNIANEKKVDMVVIAGDLYETFVPSADAERLVFDTLIELSDNGNRAVVVVAGNHDEPKRLTNANIFANKCNIYLVGDLSKANVCVLKNKRITATNAEVGYIEFKTAKGEKVVVGTLPYPSYYRFKEVRKEGENFNDKFKEWLAPCVSGFKKDSINILTSHLFTYPKNITKEDVENYELIGGLMNFVDSKNLITKAHYTALGHIHEPVCVNKANNIFYSGAPINKYFDREESENCVIIADIVAGSGVKKIEKVMLDAKKLCSKTVSSFFEAREFLLNNKQNLVKIVFSNVDFINPQDIKMLRQDFPNLITISVLPKTKNVSYDDITKKDLTNKEIFIKFMKNKTGEEPEEELTNLFLELMEELVYEAN